METFKAVVVDDEPSVCEAMKAILELEGIEVTTFTDSPAAADDIKKNTYDLVISDLKMPKMNGIELYEAIKDAVPDCIFIIITAYGTISAAAEAAKKGVYYYIPKPFTPDEVRVPLRRAIEKQQLRRQNLKRPATRIESDISFRAPTTRAIINIPDNEKQTASTRTFPNQDRQDGDLPSDIKSLPEF